MNSAARSRRFGAAALLVAFTAAALPAQAPKPAITNQDLFSSSLEAAFQAAQFYGAWGDAKTQERVQRIGYELARQTRFTEFPFTFFLVDMPVPNAFALPGGQIFVTRGMLEMGLDDDMLACLLGHEIAHVVHHHGTRMQKRATLIGLLSQALVLGVLVGAENEGRPHPSDPYSLYGIRTNEGASKVEATAAVSLVLGQLLLLSYSREFETEADDEGQRLAAAAGYDPEGARRLWQTMLERIPLNKAYGYWRTHPFEDSRMRAAEERAKYLKIQEQQDVAALRQATQSLLIDYGDQQLRGRPGEKGEMLIWLEATALAAWPQGERADGLRLARLHRLREEVLAKPAMSRDYGRLLEVYEAEMETVEELTPRSSFLGRASEEIAEMRAAAKELYPQAQKVLEGGVYETAFLEAFLGNYPQAPEVPRVALALGNAYSRLRQPAAAVEQYLETLRAAPGSPEAEKARTGLQNMAAYLEDLSALEELSGMEEEPELQKLAETRLKEMATKFGELDNGAAYLKRYPDGRHAEAVTARLNALADKLYTEVVVYQGVGDHAKALDRMNKILTYAPLSPAADQLRERTTLDS